MYLKLIILSIFGFLRTDNAFEPALAVKNWRTGKGKEDSGHGLFQDTAILAMSFRNQRETS
jgi:hypothetical protein